MNDKDLDKMVETDLDFWVEQKCSCVVDISDGPCGELHEPEQMDFLEEEI